MAMNSDWQPLEQQIYRNFLQEKLIHKKWALMVSGGLDSMALVEVFQRISPALKSEISLVHIHHGSVGLGDEVRRDDSFDESVKTDLLSSFEISKYRDKAKDFVESYARSRNLHFLSRRSPVFRESEEACRDFRYQAARQLVEQEGLHHLIFAHHENDFLETQFLRMIRGSGPEAIFKPMYEFSDEILRPFLRIPRLELEKYQLSRGFQFIEDPSNEFLDPLRNWLRKEWLPRLEERRPGSLKSFSRSLSLLAEREREPLPSEIFLYQSESISGDAERPIGFNKAIYDQLPLSLRRDVIVKVLNSQEINNFSYNHVLEVIKYLDKADKLHRFKVASLSWLVESDIVRWDSSKT